MENMSDVPNGIAAETNIYTVPEVDPALVLPILKEAVAQAKAVTFKDHPEFGPTVRYRGVVSVEGHWVAQFNVGYRVSILPRKASAREQLWTYIRQHFAEKGIPLAPVEAGQEGWGAIANASSSKKPTP